MDYCIDAEHVPCPDLIGYEVEYNLVPRPAVYRRCGFGALACAVLDFDRKVCTIHITAAKANDMEVVMHELNHCNGWTHESDQHSSYSRPWTPIKDSNP